MKKCLAFAGVVLALAPAVLLHTAVAQERPVNNNCARQLQETRGFHRPD